MVKEKKSFRKVLLPFVLVTFLALVCIERLLQISYMEVVLPGLGLMTFLTAANLLVFAIALLAIAYDYKSQSSWINLVGSLIALSTIHDWSQHSVLLAPPSTATTLMLLLIGASIFFCQSNLRYRYMGEYLAGAAMTLALVGILGRIAGRSSLEELGPFVTTSVFTSLAVLVLSLSNLQLAKGGAVMALLGDKHVPGRFVRMLLGLVGALGIFIALLANPEIGASFFSTSADLLTIFGLLLALVLFVTFSLGEMFRRESLHAELAERSAFQTSAYLEKTLEISPVGVMTVDQFGRITSANPSACEIHGYSDGGLVGKNMLELVPDGQRTDFSLLWGDIFKLGKDRKLGRSGELKALRQDGSESFIEFYVTILELHGERIAICAVIDVTERVELQQQLEKWNLELQDRITESTQELSRSNEELLQRNSELQQFTYAASHDLQTPLRGIGVYAGALKADFGKKLNAEGIQYIDFIVAEAKRLQQLISDLLSYARIDTKSLEGFEPVDLNQVVHDVEDQLRVYQDVDYEILYRDLPTVQGIRSLLVQLFYNLIENAIKYRSDNPPRITISSHTENQGYTRVIDVTDNGLGMDSKYHDRVFEVFKRLHNHEDIPGTGIGLSICKRIAERHGGSIALSSESGVGSTFSIRIASQPVPD